MPGHCGTEVRCFRYSTYWFPGQFYFSIAAMSTGVVKLSDLREDLPVALSAKL